MLSAGLEEYSFTAAVVISLLAFLISAVGGRRHIREALGKAGVRRSHVLAAVGLVVLFVIVEILLVKPTQQLFFDDAIYQGIALDILRTGQGWMCDYGTPFACFTGEIFHEPVGPSFDVAIGYALLGVNRTATYAVQFATAAIAVFFTFLIGALLFRNSKAALFSELLMALSPIVLVFATPMTSDMPYLAWSLIALFFVLVFSRRKSIWTFSAALFSLAVAQYMKVDALLLLVVLVVMYLVLDDNSIVSSFRRNVDRVWDNLLNTRALLLLLLFVIAIAPAVIFAFGESQSGNFGYQGTSVQDSCAPGNSMVATSNFGIKNFDYNICANVMFWFDSYTDDYVMQPVAFTVLAIIGAATMLYDKKRELLAVGGWFLAFFALYTAFYAGAVTYGVDWRFMLELIAQASLLAGFGCVSIIEIGSHLGRRIASGKNFRNAGTIAAVITAAVIIAVIFYSIYQLVPQLSVNPASLQQAGDARFYENFIYNSVYMVPANCLVFTYDPTLFNINNRTATQMGNIYDPQYMQNVTAQYSCLVLDYGYWCYTPNNLCTGLQSKYNLTRIASATYPLFNRTYSLYFIHKKNSTTA